MQAPRLRILCVEMQHSDVSRPTGRPRPLRDVLVALALKAVLLGALFLLFFGPSDRVHPGAAGTADQIAGPAPVESSP